MTQNRQKCLNFIVFPEVRVEKQIHLNQLAIKKMINLYDINT